MREFQFYTSDINGKLLHAGVHKLGHYSLKTIKKLERKWLVWRYEYIKKHPGNYPLAKEAKLQPKYITVFPIDSPKLAQLFTL